MSGHNKWSSIKHKKAKADAARGKIFTRLIKEIAVAARFGGGDENSNPRLRTALAAAKAANMPSANIERAIKRGTGELPGVTYEEITYEGYTAGGAALIIEVLTDNKNRTVADIRHLFSKHNGSLGESGSVAWIFDKKGVVHVKNENVDEDELMLLALEAGADDVKNLDDVFEILTEPETFEAVRNEIAAADYEIESAEVTRYPQNTVKIERKQAGQALKLMDALDEHEDVQNIYSNFDIDEKLMEELG
ncbi:MAG TPA: YebC/PmpR family DNA-binding transcriptional regulator [Bacteroidetes bacterium]|nr:YebC/PmpR family DNA-binding transcriptional regulator [Bacteroidota bacterium]